MAIKYDIAIVGATGLVGSALIELINDQQFPVGKVHLLASMNSAGDKLEVNGKHIQVGLLEQFDFEQVQLAFFAVPAEVAHNYLELASDAGCTVIDASGATIADTQVPVVVPEVNGAFAGDMHGANVVASPAAAVVAMAKVLKPLHDTASVQSISATILEPASGQGQQGTDTLAKETVKLLSGQGGDDDGNKVAFNVKPQVGALHAGGNTHLELRSALELLRLMGQTHLDINVTAVQTPVFFGHTIILHIKTVQALDVEQARQLFANAGIQVSEDDANPASALNQAVGTDDVWVSRIRTDMSGQEGLNLVLVSDNLKAGVADNMLKIAATILESE